MKYLAFTTALLIGTMSFGAHAKEVYIGQGSILCETEGAALQVLASDVEYDGSKGTCIVTDRGISAVKIDNGCGFLNPICTYRILGIGIVFAADSFLK